MISRNVVTLCLMSVPSLLSGCASSSPVPVGNQLQCPKLQAAPADVMQPVTPHFLSDWNNLWTGTPVSSTKPTSSPRG